MTLRYGSLRIQWLGTALGAVGRGTEKSEADSWSSGSQGSAEALPALLRSHSLAHLRKRRPDESLFEDAYLLITPGMCLFE